MLSVIFTIIFYFLLELSVLISKSYAWLFLSGAVIVSLVGAWRVSRQKMSLPAVFFFSLLSVLFIGVSRGFLIPQLIAVAGAVLFYVILAIYSKRLFLPIIFLNFLIFLAGIFLALVYQTANDISWPLIASFVFLFSALLFFSSIYFLIGGGVKLIPRLLSFSLVAGFVIMEFYFALSALPFNPVSIDFLVFIIYYGLWDSAWRYFSRRLTKKSLLSDALIILVSFATVFLSAKWFP